MHAEIVSMCSKCCALYHQEFRHSLRAPFSRSFYRVSPLTYSPIYAPDTYFYNRQGGSFFHRKKKSISTFNLQVKLISSKSSIKQCMHNVITHHKAFSPIHIRPPVPFLPSLFFLLLSCVNVQYINN